MNTRTRNVSVAALAALIIAALFEQIIARGESNAVRTVALYAVFPVLFYCEYSTTARRWYLALLSIVALTLLFSLPWWVVIPLVFILCAGVTKRSYLLYGSAALILIFAYGAETARDEYLALGMVNSDPSAYFTTVITLSLLLCTLPFDLVVGAKTKKLIWCALATLIMCIGAVSLLDSYSHCPNNQLSLEIPPELRTYLFASEDPIFFAHSGVDLHRLRMAAKEALSRGSFGRGGSTITMQLAKVCYLYPDKTLTRKFRQILQAIILEYRYTKEEILALYLENIPFGQGVIGIVDAAKRYYAKEPRELSAQESLALVLTLYDPLSYTPERTRSNEVIARAAVIKARVKMQQK